VKRFEKCLVFKHCKSDGGIIEPHEERQVNNQKDTRCFRLPFLHEEENGSSATFRKRQEAAMTPAVNQSNSPMFRGGAGGSATTARKRQEKMLLEGLKSLLSNLDESTTTDAAPRSQSPNPPAQRQRGRSPERKGKGKGKGKDHQDPANRPERSRSASPKHVTFQEDNSLLAQLKALVMKCDVHGEGSLLQDLKTLVLRFSQNNGPANKGEPKQPTDKKQRWNDNKEWATPKKDEAP
jgi:hypothetical protein